jgi:hypothetical protein
MMEFHLKSEFALWSLLLARQAVAMNGFIYGLPECKEIGPQYGQCSERTSIACVVEHFDLASADVVSSPVSGVTA